MAESLPTDVLPAAQAMYEALKMLPCRCRHNVPYDSGQVKQETTLECARCKAMRDWEAVNGRQI